nr:CASP-like protein 4A3 isoform X1 [Ipomoea batatas]
MQWKKRVSLEKSNSFVYFLVSFLPGVQFPAVQSEEATSQGEWKLKAVTKEPTNLRVEEQILETRLEPGGWVEGCSFSFIASNAMEAMVNAISDSKLWIGPRGLQWIQMKRMWCEGAVDGKHCSSSKVYRNRSSVEEAITKVERVGRRADVEKGEVGGFARCILRGRRLPCIIHKGQCDEAETTLNAMTRYKKHNRLWCFCNAPHGDVCRAVDGCVGLWYSQG